MGFGGGALEKIEVKLVPKVALEIAPSNLKKAKSTFYKDLLEEESLKFGIFYQFIYFKIETSRFSNLKGVWDKIWEVKRVQSWSPWIRWDQGEGGEMGGMRVY